MIQSMSDSLAVQSCSSAFSVDATIIIKLGPNSVGLLLPPSPAVVVKFETAGVRKGST